MIAPTIHLNGTSRESLLEALETAYRKLGEAYDALKQTAPNGRDYYPQGPNAIGQATSEHFARLKRIDEVRDELEALAIAIQH